MGNDKLRSPFKTPYPIPGYKSAPGVYSKVPVDGVDQEGTYDQIGGVKTFEGEHGPKTMPGAAQSHKLDKVRSPMGSNVSKG